MAYPDGTKRKRDPATPQVVSRCPPYRPSDWVRMLPNVGRLSGRVVQVSQVLGSLHEGDRYVKWLLTFKGWPGEALPWKAVERRAHQWEVDALVKAQQESNDG